jgi:hypothetical protein
MIRDTVPVLRACSHQGAERGRVLRVHYIDLSGNPIKRWDFTICATAWRVGWLRTASHRRHMKLVLDTVPNHVGPNHPWADDEPDPNWLHGTRADHHEAIGNFRPLVDPYAPGATSGMSSRTGSPTFFLT